MMANLSLVDASAQFGGTLTNPDCQFQRVCIDSRKVNHGDLFIAIKGPTNDGHDYIDEIESEICGAVVSNYCPNRAIAQWIVRDTSIALGDLAKLRRDMFDGPVIGITGSSGKTSVKEFIASILKECGTVHATQGNFNNQIGLPLTLLSLPQSAEFIVLEMGANKIGDIEYLCSVARPNISVINNIQSAHIEGFGSLERTAAAKAEIYRGLSPHGTAILNLDLKYTGDWYSIIGNRPCVTFSLSDTAANVTAEDLQLCPDGCYEFWLVTKHDFGKKEKRHVKLSLPGKHSVENALAASACSLAAGAKPREIIAGLNSVSALPGRLQTKRLSSGGWIIDDTYNANPESAKAAIDVLAERTCQRILILGDMAELGSEAKRLHREVGEHAARSGIEELLSLGDFSRHASEIFGGKHFDKLDELILYLKSLGSSNQVTFLVKGSRSSSMERVAEYLERRKKNASLD
jgi:UDP-N-acetylmuramoyl-tripeptide--D-alanyl-D-alanine ligase